MARVEVQLGSQPPVEAKIGVPRPDVAAAYPADDAGMAGFNARAAVAETGNVKLIVRACAVDGSVATIQRTIQAEAAPPRLPHASAQSGDVWTRALNAVTAELHSDMGRAPVVLDWTRSGLHETPFRPIASESDALPYLNCSIDVVVTDMQTRLAEASRVAASLVLLKTTSGFDRVEVEQSAASTKTVSIVIPVHGRWPLTRACLEQIWRTLPEKWPVEVIVVDDASPDETLKQLDILRTSEPRLKVISHQSPGGFGRACNSGAAIASGDVLVFLNNDTVPEQGWLQPLMRLLEARADAGVVGAQLIESNGWLQDSGGVVFSDATAWNLGRGSRPNDPLFARLRRVDYCSAAALATPRELFESVGGFDPLYAPAYYEDTDYCFKIRALGREVYVQPRSVVVHLEGGTAGTEESTGIKRHQTINRDRFAKRWTSELRAQPHPRAHTREAERRLAIRGGETAKRVLVVAPTAAEFDRESGSRRVFGLLTLFRERDWEVTFIAQREAVEERYRQALAELGIEAWSGPSTAHPTHALLSDPRVLLREGPFDLVLLHFWHVAESYMPILEIEAPDMPVVVDSVDLHLLRHFRKRFVAGESLFPSDGDEAIRELNVYSRADRVLAVSEREAGLIDNLLGRPGHALALSDFEQVPTLGTGLDGRRGLLFVGNFRHHPNVEALEWLMTQIVRRLSPSVLAQHPLRIVGNALTPDLVARFRDFPGSMEWIGWVPAVEPYLRAARLTVAPLRSGAGTKRKIVQSLMCGTPVVTTSIGAEGLDLEQGQHALIANDADEFACAAARLTSDDELWRRLSIAGEAHARSRHSRESVKPAFDEMLRTTKKTV